MEEDEELKIFKEWAIANNRDPELTRESLDEFKKDLLEKRDETLRLKAERDRKIREVGEKLVGPLFIIGIYIFIFASGFHDESFSVADPVGILTDLKTWPWNKWLGWGCFYLVGLGAFMQLVVYYRSLQSQYGRIATLATIALAGWILFWILQELVYDTKPTSVPSGAVTEKDSSVRNMCEDAECMEIDSE